MYALLNEHKNIWLNLHRSVPLKGGGIIPKNLIFEMLQFLLSISNVAHQRVLLFLQLRTLFAYDITQQLSLKTLTHTHNKYDCS